MILLHEAAANLFYYENLKKVYEFKIIIEHASISLIDNAQFS